MEMWFCLPPRNLKEDRSCLRSIMPERTIGVWTSLLYELVDALEVYYWTGLGKTIMIE